jgi:hypothetical protein
VVQHAGARRYVEVPALQRDCIIAVATTGDNHGDRRATVVVATGTAAPAPPQTRTRAARARRRARRAGASVVRYAMRCPHCGGRPLFVEFERALLGERTPWCLACGWRPTRRPGPDEPAVRRVVVQATPARDARGQGGEA